MPLHEKLSQTILSQRRDLLDQGVLPTQEKLEQYYATFRAHFSPDRLLSIDGQDLLETIHDHGKPHSLVYWLEFKNDDVQPAIFGSIAGGSALKFGLYRRKETGRWMTGHPAKQEELTLEGAIQVARRHRGQLVRAAELLERLPEDADDAAYQQLQEQLDQECPDIADKAWGHKYLHMLYPAKLDDYHVEYLQRFHLIKLLQLPPEGKGRYLAAGRYVAIAGELDLPINHLATTLNHIHGASYRYWRIGTTPGDVDYWAHMRDSGIVAIGWPELGDLADIGYDRGSKEKIRTAMQTHYENTPQMAGRKTQEVFNFVAAIGEGDLVLAAKGRHILGIGKVTGGYIFAPGERTPHRRLVEWLSLEEWDLPVDEGLLTTVCKLQRREQNLVEVERRLFDAPAVEVPPKPPVYTSRLSGIPGQIQSVLERKKQVILYGPPGTGKTYWARQTARELAAQASFGQPYGELSDDQKGLIDKGDADSGPLVRMCTFHPAYGYEDFLEGYRPQSIAGQLSFDLRDGLFKRLCDDARKHSDHRFYLIIDEINRGDIPRIFGELLTILERDKRDQELLLPLSGEPFSIPDNVYVIGTMNTADRSIALLDTALRRRFGFIELMPDSSLLDATVVGNSIPLGPWLDALNERILEHIGRDARNLQVGHAYLMDKGRPVTNWAKFARIVQEDILPLLEEYCYEDYASLAKILGTGLVDEARQRIHHELFDPVQRDKLILALLAPAPDIATSRQAVIPEEDLEEQDNDDVGGEVASG